MRWDVKVGNLLVCVPPVMVLLRLLVFLNVNWRKIMTYENKIKRLNEIVAALEDSSVALDESVKLYEEGATLLKDCFSEIQQCKGKITVIKKELSALAEKPFKPTDEADD